MYNRVFIDADRERYADTIDRMRRYWPQMFARKIPQSMVQFAFAYQTALDIDNANKDTDGATVLAAGSHEDIATECLKLDGFAVVGIDPVINEDLHSFVTRAKFAKFDYVVSASVLEHVENDEEFVADCCNLLYPGGYGIFTMDFKDSWHQGERVPTTSRRFYTTADLTHRLVSVLNRHDCVLLDEPNYTAIDNFNWEGIQYSFASFVFRKNK